MLKPQPMTLGRIPNGMAGTLETLKKMRQLVRAGKTSPLVRQFTASLIAPIRPQKNYTEMIREIHSFVRDHVAYVKDIRGVETLHAPEFVLRNRYGDCDDKSVLAASMLESVGFPTKLVACGQMPGVCSHVYVEVKIGRHWVPVECTENVPLGWCPPGIKCRRTLEV